MNKIKIKKTINKSDDRLLKIVYIVYITYINYIYDLYVICNL